MPPCRAVSASAAMPLRCRRGEPARCQHRVAMLMFSLAKLRQQLPPDARCAPSQLDVIDVTDAADVLMPAPLLSPGTDDMAESSPA